ncbi:hypothetical protein [Streptomyces sp. NPDC001276]|uniref:hypothetical protein n=1 Tax=unclassified Streptomyces TaxID=2593676 RepID=UPI003677F493
MTGELLKPGIRLRSVTCDTQVIVVRAPSTAQDLRCGGVPMTRDLDSCDPQPIVAAFAGGAELGKRYTDGADLEVLVTKPGQGTLSIGSEPMSIQGPKRLPSSD